MQNVCKRPENRNFVVVVIQNALADGCVHCIQSIVLYKIYMYGVYYALSSQDAEILIFLPGFPHQNRIAQTFCSAAPSSVRNCAAWARHRKMQREREREMTRVKVFDPSSDKTISSASPAKKDKVKSSLLDLPPETLQRIIHFLLPRRLRVDCASTAFLMGEPTHPSTPRRG